MNNTTTLDTLTEQRNALMDAVESALDEVDMCKETLYRVAGSAAEASAQAALSRAYNAYEAAMQAFDEWIVSPDGEMYDKLS